MAEDDDKYDETDGAAASSSEEKHSKAVRMMEQVSFANDVHAQATEEQDNYEEDDKNDECLPANIGPMDMQNKKRFASRGFMAGKKMTSREDGVGRGFG